MDIYEAAQILHVAAHEISAVEQDELGWVAVHEDLASHVTARRRVVLFDLPAETLGESGPEEAAPSVGTPKKAAKKTVKAADDSSSD